MNRKKVIVIMYEKRNCWSHRVKKIYVWNKMNIVLQISIDIYMMGEGKLCYSTAPAFWKVCELGMKKKNERISVQN